MKRNVLIILLILSAVGAANAQSDTTQYADLKRVKFRLAFDTPSKSVLEKEQLQHLLPYSQYESYNRARRCYHASIPLLSVGGLCITWGSLFFVGGIVAGIQGDGFSSYFLMLFSAAGFVASLPTFIPGVILITRSAKKLNKIASDYNSRHYQSSLQLQFGFVGNGIGMKLKF